MKTLDEALAGHVDGFIDEYRRRAAQTSWSPLARVDVVGRRGETLRGWVFAARFTDVAGIQMTMFHSCFAQVWKWEDDADERAETLRAWPELCATALFVETRVISR